MQMTKDRKKMLDELRAIDFALVETVLYLDAYPNCEAALAYYHKQKERREVLAHEYEKYCGPLTALGNTSKTTWDWTKDPYPWEYDAN